MKRRFTTKSLRLTWLLSYIFVIVIPIAFSLFVYFEYNKTLAEQTEEFNDYILKTTNITVSNILSDIKTLRYEVAFDKYIDDFLSIKNPMAYYTTSESYRFVKDFQTYYGAILGNVDFHYIYLKETDMVLSKTGLQTSELFFKLYFDNSDQTYDEWINFLKEAKHEDFSMTTMTYDNAPVEALSCTIALPVGSSKTGDKGTLVISTAKDKFFYGLEDIKWLSLCDIYIYDTKGNLILSQVNSNADAALPKTLQKIPVRPGYTVLSDYVTLDTTTWTIISLVPQDVMFARIIYMKRFTLASIFICLVLLYFAVRSLVQKNYKPVKALLDILPENSEQNEYESIKKTIRTTLSENQILSRNIEKQNLELRDATLNRLLKTSNIYMCDEDLLESYGVVFPGNNFTVCAFYVQDIEELFADDHSIKDMDKYPIMKFILSNIVEELMYTENSKAFITENNGMFIALINTTDTFENLQEFLLEKLSFAADFISRQFSVNITFAVSLVHTKANISQAYTEALEGIEYQNMMGILSPVFYKDIKKDFTDDYYFGIDTERLLIDHIKKGNYPAAANIINKIFENIEGSDNISLEYAKCLMFDIAASMLKIPSEIQATREEILKKFNPNRILLYCDNIFEMKKVVLNSIKEICELAYREQETLSQKFKEQIVSYVHDHYSDTELNVSKIGLAFNMSPSYLSRLFKDGYGESLVSFINRYRIAKAKTLLETTNLSVNEISAKVGYGNIRTFNRVFKDLEGVSPKKYY